MYSMHRLLLPTLYQTYDSDKHALAPVIEQHGVPDRLEARLADTACMLAVRA